MFVMVNPSTADAAVKDATIRRCMGFATRDRELVPVKARSCALNP
jgi:hypothetical protein